MIKATLLPLVTMLLLGNWNYTTKEAKTTETIALCSSPIAINKSQSKEKKEIQAIDKERARTVILEIVPEKMKFNQDTFKVKASEKILLEIDNLDGMQHNLLILKPGTLELVGAAADAMLRDPKASEKFYIPEIPEVLFSTEMIGPQELYTLSFTAPSKPGNYPFVCTFPGHWRMMKGIMVVS